MTYVDDLRRALADVGIQGRLARRIVLEFDDHLACDPSAADRLGEPALVAERFADELATARGRRSALAAFGALAVVGLAYTVPLVAITQAGGYPDVFAGRSTAVSLLAGLAMFVAPQLAFVAGVLAAVRAVRRRGVAVLPASEVRVLRRRAGVGLGAGIVAAVGVGLYAVNFSGHVAAWWTNLALACSGAAVLVSGIAATELARGRGLRPAAAGSAGGLAEDFPFEPVRRLEGRPWVLAASVGAPLLAVTVLTGLVDEGYGAGGLVRAAVECVAFGGGFLLLGRFLGIRR